MAKIISVDFDSPAYQAGLCPGDELLRVNEKGIQDVLDYKYYTYDSLLNVTIIRNCEILNLHINKADGQELGLNFETYLMDEARSCQNKCIFCFIDQLPPGMRETLYFKDDDARLSFLQGNYITMTNLSEREIQRIIELKISPVNISIHTTNPELRAKMLNNRFAGNGYEIMKRLAACAIEMNAQIVACPGYNTGSEMERTIDDLASLYPALHSVSIVPVGITKFRGGLAEIPLFDSETAKRTIDLVTICGDKFIKMHGSRVFYCADELFVKSGLELPEEEYYEDYPQLENGVGMLRLMYEEFLNALDNLEKEDQAANCTIATGVAAAPFFSRLIDLLKLKCHNVKCEIIAISNEFFGESIDVTGLVTGGDLIRQLKGKPLGDKLLISDCMLRSGEDIFLDDVTLTEVQNALDVQVVAVENDGMQLLNAIIY